MIVTASQLELLRGDAIRAVRSAARAARERILTPGKETTYAAKLAEAQAAPGSGKFSAKELAAYPYISSEAARSGVSFFVARRIILDNAARAAAALRTIDDAELNAVAEVKVSGDLEAQAATVRSALKALEAIR